MFAKVGMDMAAVATATTGIVNSNALVPNSEAAAMQALIVEKERKKLAAKYALMSQSQAMRQLFLDIEAYERKYRRVEAAQAAATGFVDKSEVTLVWMEMVTRKDLYKSNTLLNYEPLLELKKDEKALLFNFFDELSGFSWKSHFGWTGQTQTVARLGIDPFEASTYVYEGIKMAKNNDRPAAPNEGYITELNLPGKLNQALLRLYSNLTTVAVHSYLIRKWTRRIITNKFTFSQELYIS